MFTKVPFVRSALSGHGREFSTLLYREYLLKSNGGAKFNEDEKFDILDYESSFSSLISSLRKNGYQGTPIPLGKTGIVNGAHRLAVSLVLDLDLKYEPVAELDHTYDYKFMRRIGMEDFLIEQTVLEYLQFEKRARCFLLTDFTKNELGDFTRALSNYSQIIFENIWEFNSIGIRRILDLAYGHLEWWTDSQYEILLAERFRDRTNSYPAALVVHIPFSPSQEEPSIKTEIRLQFKHKKFERNIHESDNYFETMRLCDTLLNFNGRFFLNNSPINREEEAIAVIAKKFSSSDRVAVSGSTILSLFTDYQAADLDIVSVKVSELEFTSEHERSFNLAPWGVSDVLTDPRRHFVYKGIKFISLPVWAGLRLSRLESKVEKQIKSLLQLPFSGATSTIYADDAASVRALRYRRTKNLADKLSGLSNMIPPGILRILRRFMTKLYS